MTFLKIFFIFLHFLFNIGNGGFMKYLIILPIVFFAMTAASQTSPSPDTENCHYRTEDSHVVSNNSYSRLLAQISADPDERKKKKKKRQKPTGTGQR